LLVRESCLSAANFCLQFMETSHVVVIFIRSRQTR